MSMPTISMEDRIIGCLLGLMVGDSLGAHFEGQTPDRIHNRFHSWKKDRTLSIG